jgi:hypothetical protein
MIAQCLGKMLTKSKKARDIDLALTVSAMIALLLEM